MTAVTLADLRYRFRQFLIAVVGAGMVLGMGLLMAGLVGGFHAETSNTVESVGANHWVLTTGSAGRIAAVGLFPESQVAVVAKSPGVTRADPLVLLPQEVALVNGKSKTVNIMGVQDGGLGDPTVTSGRSLTGPHQIVVDSQIGAPVGSSITVGDSTFTVVGQVKDRTLLGGGPIVYMSLPDAQAVALGGRPLVSAVVTQGSAPATAAGYQVLTNQQVEQNTLAALSQAVSSINNSKILMWVVAGIIIAALLYVSALQRVRDFAVLKALGSSSRALFGSLAMQAVIVSLAAAIFGTFISKFMGGVFAQPVAVPLSAYLTLPIVAIIVGLLSSLVALRRATGADPAAAFGG
jgi:putative ABC transport system permease protein